MFVCCDIESEASGGLYHLFFLPETLDNKIISVKGFCNLIEGNGSC